MPKPDPALLDPARYPFCGEVATRFSDLDINLHINNVAMVELIESGRSAFHRASGFDKSLGPDMSAMLASLSVEYLGQGYYPEPVAVSVGVSGLGRSSYTLAQLITQTGHIVAYAQVVLVCMRGGAPAPVPDLFTSDIDRWRIRS